MKKLFSIALCICLTLAAVFVVAPSFNKANADAVDSTTVSNLLSGYAEGGRYVKTTHIQTDKSGKDYFHAGADDLSRITLYDGRKIYMTNSEGTINSGYKTEGENKNFEHYKFVDGEEYTDYTVVGQTVEDKYVDLAELANRAKEEGVTWESIEDEGVTKYQMTSALTTPWVHFIAPMWIGTTEGLTVRVWDNGTELYLQLWNSTSYFAQAIVHIPTVEAGEENIVEKYTFSSYATGTQYAQGEEHTLDENVTMTINGAHLNTQVRLYAGSNAVFAVDGTIKSITPKAGYKAGTLTVYGSTDGKSWTKIGTAETTTSYKEYTFEFTGSYTYFKLESTGAQIRVSELTIDFTKEAEAGGCPHFWATEITEATCVDAGVILKTCALGCGESTTTETPVNDHTFGDWVVTTAPTCTSVGESTRVCEDCGHEETEPVDKIAHNFEGGVCTECGEEQAGGAEPTWELVTDVSTLAAGDQIVIVANNADYALSTNQKSSNRGATAITKSGNTVTFGDDVQIITLEAGTAAGTFAFYTGSGYLYAASSSGNQLKTKAAKDVNGSWTITITDGVASIVAKASSNRNVMQYNPNNGSPLFACYASASQTAIQIYKKVG